MALDESIVEDAALAWFGDPPSPRLLRTGLGYAVGHAPHLAPLACRDGNGAGWGERAADWDSLGEVVLVGRSREAIRRPAPAGPAIPEDMRPTGKRDLQVRAWRETQP
jgi:hypothetical protein